MRDAVKHFGAHPKAQPAGSHAAGETCGDTIAAIATASGEAGIAVIRVSGPSSMAIADAVLDARGRRPSSMRGGTFLHGTVNDPSGMHGRADEAVCLIFRAPHSYTGEDVVELQCHGGRVAAERVLKAALAGGARVAEPGEFTRRAFLNGRMDLLQAEAVLDLIRARSDAAATMALRQLDGVLTDWATVLYDGIMSTLAEMEADLDFPEEDVPDPDTSEVANRLTAIAGAVREALATSRPGRLAREGALMVIAGQPNAGKSTLMNRLLNHERSIVSDVPGTTRDVVEDTLVINGVAVRVADTAGLRDTACDIEKEGIRRARKAMDGADVVLYVVDGSQPPSVADLDGIKQAGVDRTILVLNKSDLGIRHRADWPTTVQCVAVSARTGAGEEDLITLVSSKIGTLGDAAHPVMVAERHREILDGVLGHLVRAREILASQGSDRIVLAASELHGAVDLLGTMTGRNYTEDLLDSIFGRFCIGK
jgi:tRNA modification GTPase